MTSNTLIKLEKIRYLYPGGSLILDDLDFKLKTGARVGLVAPNGSGKTTLFYIILGLLKPDAGKICLFNQICTKEKDFAKMRQHMGLLFQDTDDQLFCPTVLEDVAFGPLNQGKSADQAKAIAAKTLAFLGLQGFEERIIHKLSGGEKRLVALATVLAMEPEVLLLDEPTTGLDDQTISRLIKILEGLQISLLIISHNPDFLKNTTNQMVSMQAGKICSLDTAKLHPHYHSHIYAHQSHPHLELHAD